MKSQAEERRMGFRPNGQIPITSPVGKTEREVEHPRSNRDETASKPAHFRTGSSGRLIAFAGSTPNVGTTIAAFGTAYLLAKASELRIGFLCLNLKSSKLHRYLDRDGKAFTLSELRADLKTGSLQPGRLLRACEPLCEAPNLHVLYGNTQREMADLYTANEISHLLQVARATFDYCFIDVNAYWDNAATVCGMQLADARFIVTTGDMGHFQEDIDRWIYGVGAALGFVSEQFSLIVTHMAHHSTEDGLKLRDIAQETGMQLFGKVGAFGDVFTHSNQGRLIELLNGVHPLQRQLFEIVRRLSVQYEIALMANSKNKRWFRKMLGGTAAVY